MKQFVKTFLLIWLPFILNAQKIEVTYYNANFKGPFTGKVLLFLSKEEAEPRTINFMLRINPYFAVSVTNIKPGEKIIFDDNALSYPAKLSEIERGGYFVQVVWDRNLGGRAIGTSPGNIYSHAVKLQFGADHNATMHLACDEMIPEPVFENTRFSKEIKLRSDALSKFFNKDFFISAAVKLPPDFYDKPEKKFPLHTIVFGYGGDYHGISGDTSGEPLLDTISFVALYLDGNCALGHSVYANSENNGPWGDALVKELIPEVEKQYRCNGFRSLFGHSSGGWSVLWLQTHYPDAFNACWSSSPDPVDFRNFQKINLYEDDNMFYGKDSGLNAAATIAGFIPIDYMKDYYQMEAVQYRGQQMHSFDAVFSARGKNGEPESICDAGTGRINKQVAEHWKNYDISLYLRNNWSSLHTSLDNKITVAVGDHDNFLLNYAVHVLDEEMKKLNAKMQFRYESGDHMTIFTKEYQQAIKDFIKEKYLEWLQKK